MRLALLLLIFVNIVLALGGASVSVLVIGSGLCVLAALYVVFKTKDAFFGLIALGWLITFALYLDAYLYYQ